MSLDDFLANPPANPSRCLMCRNEKLAAEIADYVTRKGAGAVHHSMHFMFQKYFSPTYGLKSFSSFQTHIRMHLKADL